MNDAGGRVWLRRATKRAPLDFKGLGNGRKMRPRRGFPRTRGRAGPGSSMCGRCDLAKSAAAGVRVTTNFMRSRESFPS